MSFSERFIREFERIKHKLDRASGPGLVNSSGGMRFYPPNGKRLIDPRNPPPGPLHAKILSSSAINGGIRYKYTIEIGLWDMTGSSTGVWVTISDTVTLYAFNSAEDMNTFGSGTGTIGTGNTSVAQSDGTIGSTTCKMKALPNNGYVVVMFRGADSSGQLYYTICNMANSSQ